MTYRDVASKQVLVWAGTSVGARMPVAMTPLALVFLVRERPGGYALGAVLAAAYVLGEIVCAPVVGMRLRPDRARPTLTVGLATGAAGFAALGAFPGAHPVVLAALAAVAGGAPASTTGALRAMLTDLVPERAASQALSIESMLVSGIWAVAPVAVTGLALGVAPRAPLLLACALMASAIGGLWLLPAGWRAGDTQDVGDRSGADDTDDAGEKAGAGDTGVRGAGEPVGRPRFRLLLRAWPLFVTGAAGLALLGLAEIVLPALLEQRGVGVGWAGPMLTGLAVGGAVGAFLHGLRAWPGTLRGRSAVLMCAMSACVTLVALIPNTGAVAVALAMAGILQSAVLLTRNLSLREALPPGALAAGYAVMYAAAGAGYAVTGSFAGALLKVAAPSTAVLAGVGLTLALTGVGWWGEVRRARSAAGGAYAALGVQRAAPTPP